MWLIGLGVAVPHNRPRHCQENGRVERAHGVLGPWADPATCADAAAVPTALTTACRVPREASPALRGETRATAFPVLMAGGRPFDPTRAGAVVAARRVWADLAGTLWTRRVDKVGRISVSNRALGVGRGWTGQEVTLQFAAEAVAWVIRDDRGTELVRHPAPELSRARLLALDVAHQR